ncbi:hypothetical protein [Cellulophaga sp. L1A9]|uniref:hypothetical protein n=1 Tax=Cellulophaga sp. L1A9 TaxID=2686362 RepID=UPI00131DF4D7|nr:hypothetical protein [Cellulophaga sp. L1A9]
MNSTIEEQLQLLKEQTLRRKNQISAFKKSLLSNYDTLVLANGLDELRDINILILDCDYTNRNLLKLIDEAVAVKDHHHLVDRIELDTLVITNLSCVKEFQSLKVAMGSIRSPKTEETMNALSMNNSLGQRF